MAKNEKLEKAYQKAYGDYWKTKFAEVMAARAPENAKAAENREQQVYTAEVNRNDTKYMDKPLVYTAPEAEKVHEMPVVENSEQQVYTAEVNRMETKYMEEAPVYTPPEAEKVQEASVAEQTAPEPAKEEVSQPQTQGNQAKDAYPSLFNMFTEMMGGNQGGDPELAAMFALAFGALIAVEEFKQRLGEAERMLAEAQKREQERVTDEPEKAQAAVQPEIKVEKEKSSAEKTYDKIAQGKDQVTLGDLQQAGVNLKTDLQPTLRALTKDHPEKLAEFAPKGLGDEKAPVNREFATALIARAQQREAITRHNALSR